MGELEVLWRQQLTPRVTEMAVSVPRDGSYVPAIAWLPPKGDCLPPVVLFGHGGSGHKAIDRHRRMGSRLAGESGIAALAIDGPYHGDRAVPGDGPLDYQQRVVAEGPVATHERMRDDWLTLLAAATEAQLVDGDSVAYLGVSMGARYGMAVCAALGARLRAAVIGKFGLAAPDPMMVAMAADDLVRGAATAITAPVLHHGTTRCSLATVSSSSSTCSHHRSSRCVAGLGDMP
jgi:dienelactone hydrolase